MGDFIGCAGLVGVEVIANSLRDYFRSGACTITTKDKSALAWFVAQDIFNRNMYFDREKFVEDITN